MKTYCKPHESSKQYKTFVKTLAKALCESLDKDAIKDVETALAGLRSQKVSEALRLAAEAKKGVEIAKFSGHLIDAQHYQ